MSTACRKYFAIVAFLQLLLVSMSGAACAAPSDLNLPTQLNQTSPPLQPLPPNFQSQHSHRHAVRHHRHTVHSEPNSR